MMTLAGKLRLSQYFLVSQVVGEGGGGEGGSGEGENDAVARSTGSHCGGQAKVWQCSVGQVLEPAQLTTFDLFATLGLGTCGLLLLVVMVRAFPSSNPTFPSQNLPKGSPVARRVREV